MTQTAVRTYTSAQVVVTTLTLIAGIGIAAAFIGMGHETKQKTPNSVARQFIELEKPAPATTTDNGLGSS